MAPQGAEIALVGGNFGSSRGNSYVLFGSVRAAASDYLSWGNIRIALKIPTGAPSADVKVVTANGESGSIHLEVEEEGVVYRLPYSGALGYDPPAVTGNPKGAKFEFQSIGTDLRLIFDIKTVSADDVRIYLNGRDLGPAADDSGDWSGWSWLLRRSDQRTGRNIIEFRHVQNRLRSSAYVRWQIRDIALWKPFDAKRPVALGGQQLPLSYGLGNPYPSPFNSEVTISFALAQDSPLRIVVYDLAGQEIRTLFAGTRAAGSHLLVWDGRNGNGSDAASGVYTITATGPGLRQSKRVVLLR